MRAIILKTQGGIENLQMMELPVPRPGGDEVLIAVRNPSESITFTNQQTFKLEEIPLAHLEIEKNNTQGKIIIQL